ncbi:hypothetical protein FC15_GL000927 [Lapidilactobacillus concavus DSM 17758]|uniref:Uncharacterized protein n=1 Tax=Lapidilactobacillus concavus DSM 17758 TaxID=1423735 RepID=A0A0R1W738_9LACO|nr:DUF960 family protein [Lapidilactobacillus concavus]KRM13760.1 hypothetical protein FC15_GL000927 [Lapidilactobacillus concavus DSM 17758]GEL12641.1 GTP cyclohydrolase [Lapidilactobacillus concavus]
MFKTPANRFASFGVVAVLPGELIDQIWLIIDRQLKGLFPLNEQVLSFELRENDKQQVQYIYYLEDNNNAIAFDTDYAFQEDFPEALLVYDDGKAQTILLPSEAD